MIRRCLLAPLLALFALLLLLACRQPPQTLSPSARPDLLATLREDLEAERHPADGGGRAWLETDGDAPVRVAASAPARLTLVYEAGDLGIAEGGMLFLQVSPFWGWSTPQVEDPQAPGFTVVSTEAAGVELEASTLAAQLLGVRIAGRALAPGERISLLYGAGPAAARTDRFAERASRFFFAVDGDGDGVRGLVEPSPEVEVVAGPPAQIVLLLPTTAAVGDTVRLNVALLDRSGNAGVPVDATLELSSPTSGLAFARQIDLRAEEGGRAEVDVEVLAGGVHLLEAEGVAMRAMSNPLVVDSAADPLLWADLHGHSGLSDGTGTPEDYYLYARDIAALDVVALTDHDHWGMRPLSTHPELWQEIRDQTERFHQPGRFVTLLGYEWTNWLHGHRHVLYFADDGAVLSSVDPAYEHPEQLWDALRGQPALTFAHHSAGGPVAINWDIPPDPQLEPVTEIVSVHGSSEAADSPIGIYAPVAGNYVRDALERGYRLGFIGSGDSHDGHPGLAHLASSSGGLAAILAPVATRERVLEALRARRVYATNGPRIYLDVELDGHPMGASVPLGSAGTATLSARIVAVAPLARIELIRSGRPIASRAAQGHEHRLTEQLTGLRPGDFLYLRAVQEDGGAAWSSPFFLARSNE